MNDWVRVEFYGQHPAPEELKNIDLLHIARLLAVTFGFTHIDSLSLRRVTEHCDGDPTSSRLCRLGTKGCNKQHAAGKDPLPLAPG